MLDCLQQGEAPYASHLLYTQCLDDRTEEQRTLGMLAGFDWAEAAYIRVVYTDLGVSEGMYAGIRHAFEIEQDIDFRKLPQDLLKRFQAGEDLNGIVL
jgi:hypothetical protein